MGVDKKVGKKTIVGKKASLRKKVSSPGGCLVESHMKPNGFVVMGRNSKPVLVDFDDDGKVADGSGTVLDTSDWSDRSVFSDNILVLVHTVKGESKMLLKALLVTRLEYGKQNVSSVVLGKKGLLFPLAEKMWMSYMKVLQDKGSPHDAFEEGVSFSVSM